MGLTPLLSARHDGQPGGSVPINADKKDRWRDDIRASVDLYNEWFTTYAPFAYREVREKARRRVIHALDVTGNLCNLHAEALRENPGILPVLRMATSPPLAVDRLVGLAGVSKSLVANLESGRLPARMSRQDRTVGLEAVAEVLFRMMDRELFVWIENGGEPSEIERVRAASVVADRLTLSIANPAIRNAQEVRQLEILGDWFKARGYEERRHPPDEDVRKMQPGTYSYRMNVEGGAEGQVRIPVDAVIQPHVPRQSGLPILIEAKSAGDFTNVNKRRKEEASKMHQLQLRHGDSVEYILFLGGYFDRGYLEYEARAGIDWVWEHRPDDLAELNLDRETG